jgi:hypothetical protein
MDLRRKTPRLVFAVLAMIGGLPGLLAAQSLVWSNPWTEQSAPSLTNYSVFAVDQQRAAVAFADNGDVVIAEGAWLEYSADYRIVRLAPDGNLRWAANLPYDSFWFSGSGSLIATSDGGAFATSGYEDGYHDYEDTRVARIRSDGSIAWIRDLSAWWMTQASNQRIVTVGCDAITALDASTGATVWQYTIPSNSNSHDLGGHPVADPQGNVYATIPTNSGFDVLKLNTAGHVVWELPVADNTANAVPDPIGVSSGILLLNAGSLGAIGLHTNNGSTAWSDSLATIQTLVGTPAEPFVVKSGVFQRLAAATGNSRWTQSISASFLGLANGQIIVDASNALSSIDPDSGAVSWTSVGLPTQDANGNTLQFVTAGNGGANQLTAVARTSNSMVSTPSVFLQPATIQNGQLLVAPTLATTQKSLHYGSSVTDNNGHVYSVALGQNVDWPEVLVRCLDTATGALVWENREPFDGDADYPTMVIGNGQIVVALQNNSKNGEYGAIWLAAFDGQTGDLDWQRLVHDEGQQLTYATTPRTDSLGDVYLGFGSSIPTCSDPYYCSVFLPEQSILKFASMDGALLWRFDNKDYDHLTSQPGQPIAPLGFSMLGDDVVVAGPFVNDSKNNDVIKLSGNDGTAVWKSAVFGGNEYTYIDVAQNNILIVHGGGKWAKLAAATGDTLWTNANTLQINCSEYCQPTLDALVMPDGDVYDVGEADWKPLIILTPAIEGGTRKTWRLDPNPPALHSYITKINRDSGGKIWLVLQRRFSHFGSSIIGFLTGFDPNTGLVTEQQALWSYNLHDLLAQNVFPTPLVAPENNRLLAHTFVSQPPELVTHGDAMIDTTVQATGDLSISAFADPPGVQPGGTTNFHIIANYTGDNAIFDAHLISDFYNVGVPASLTCSTRDASNCTLVNRNGVISASFDIQPGGQVEVVGQALITGVSTTVRLQSIAYGPVGLSEQNTLNNFSQIQIGDKIFSDGF